MNTQKIKLKELYVIKQMHMPAYVYVHLMVLKITSTKFFRITLIVKTKFAPTSSSMLLTTKARTPEFHNVILF